jgi:O-antigen/teichoic acid export membrane protein
MGSVEEHTMPVVASVAPGQPAPTPVRAAGIGSRLGSLVHNSASIMGTTVVNAGLGYLYWTLAARSMPEAEVGIGSAIVSAMVILSLSVHLGAAAGLIARLPSRSTPQQWRLTVVAVVATSSMITLALAAIVVHPLGALVPPLRELAENPVLAAWFVLGAAAWTCSDLLDHVFIAERRSRLMTTRNAATALTKLAILAGLAVVVPALTASDVVMTWALGGLAGTSVGLLTCHVRVRALGRVPLRQVGGELSLVAKQVLGHHAISVCGLVPTYLLPVVVTAQLGAQQNAYFYVTWMVGSSVFMISPSVSAALFAEGSHDRARLGRLSSRSLMVIFGLLLVPCVVMIVGGRTILSLFGPGYPTGYALLVVLVLSALPDAISNVAVSNLRVRGRLRAAAALNGTMAALALAGAWFATPVWGIFGAGMAWLGAQVCGALGVLMFARARRRVRAGRHGRAGRPGISPPVPSWRAEAGGTN